MKRLKLAIVFLIALLPLIALSAKKDNIANYYPAHGTPTSYIDKNGNIVAPTGTVDSLIVNTDVTLPDISLEAEDIAVASTKFIVGNAGGTGTAVNASGDLAMDNAGAFTIQVGAVEEAMLETSVTVSLALADSSAQKDEVYGSSTAVNGSIGSGQLIVTNAITMLDIASSAFEAYSLIHVWMSETSAGSATTNNIEGLVLSTGSAVATVIANAEYWYVTGVDGTAIATITATASLTNYINIGVGPRVTSTEIIFVP